MAHFEQLRSKRLIEKYYLSIGNLEFRSSLDVHLQWQRVINDNYGCKQYLYNLVILIISIIFLIDASSYRMTSILIFILWGQLLYYLLYRSFLSFSETKEIYNSFCTGVCTRIFNEFTLNLHRLPRHNELSVAETHNCWFLSWKRVICTFQPIVSFWLYEQCWLKLV